MKCQFYRLDWDFVIVDKNKYGGGFENFEKLLVGMQLNIVILENILIIQ